MTPAIVVVMTPPTIGNMPSKGTKRRTIRIDDELWDAVSRIAAEAGKTVSEILRAELERYIKKNGSK